MASNLIKENDKFVEYKYKITEFYIIVDGKEDKFPVERITDFRIEHYFEDASFPIFKMELVMEPSRYYKIIKNKSNVRFKLRVQMYYTSRNDENDKSLLRDVINSTFCIYTDEDSDDYEEDLKRLAGTQDDINQLDKLNNVVDLYLFKDIVSGIRSSFNVILNNCTMCTAVTYLLYKAGVKNVLMSPFENTSVYGTLLLPPQSIEKQLKFLNNNYGFYKKGAIVYFGLLHNYVLNYKGGCTAWYKKEWKETVIYVLEKSNNMSFLSGAIIKPDEERYYYNASPSAISVSSNTVSTNVIQGTDADVIDMRNYSTISSSSGAKTSGKTNSKAIFNTRSNKYLAETFAAQQKANSTVISIVLENLNIESFNPNKSISVIFENTSLNSKYKGTYRVANAIYNFTPTSNDYALTAALVLKKVD